jgi:hypothetical protein
MKKNIKLNSAVLFLVFNRPDLTERVFEEIRKAKPARLYLASDGPRKEIEGENNVVKEVRNIVNVVDWPCKVKKLFRKNNLGCKQGVSQAINWFFKHEKEGIILEDDCLPSQSFFIFCEKLLKKYRNSDISMISGYTILEQDSTLSYRYSHLMNIWGWASWRRSWKYYNPNLDIKDIEINNQIFLKFLTYSNSVKKTFINFVKQKVDTWDIQWIFTCMKEYNYAIMPTKSLIENIGFDKRATHTKYNSRVYTSVSRNELTFPLKFQKNKNLYEINDLDQKYLSILNKKSYRSPLSYLSYFMKNFTQIIKCFFLVKNK